MIEIQLNDRVIKVQPEITIEQFQRLQYKEDLYKTSPPDLLSLFLNVPVNELKDLPLNQMEFVQSYLVSEMTESSLKNELYNIFTHNGVEYGLENDWSKLAWGAWMDMEVFSSEKIEENIHLIMAILYRPITEKKNGNYKIKPYKADEIEDRAYEFRQLPIKYWFGASSFFFLTVTIFTNNIKSSLEWTNRVNRWMMKGWQILPRWVKKRLPLDTILVSHSTLQEKTLPKLTK
jgi:hypothetical protein